MSECDNTNYMGLHTINDKCVVDTDSEDGGIYSNITEGVDFLEKFDEEIKNAGIVLRKFKFNELEYKVDKSLHYQFWGSRYSKIGEHYIGIYKISNEEQESVALILDSVIEKEWIITLIQKTDTEEEMKDWLCNQKKYITPLSHYILKPIKNSKHENIEARNSHKNY